jgi:hypothetical protein
MHDVKPKLAAYKDISLLPLMSGKKTTLHLAIIPKNIPFFVSGRKRGEKGKDPGGHLDGG